MERVCNPVSLGRALKTGNLEGYWESTGKATLVVDRSAKAAIRQIRERGYADKWIGGPRPVTLIGINFNPKKRNIDIPIVEPA